MEAALVNVLSPGDTMLALVAGNFGERWAALGKAYGMNVKELQREVGRGGGARRKSRARSTPIPPSAPSSSSSTSRSTGAAHDVEALARLTRERKDTLLVVDAISGAGAHAPGDGGLGRGRGRGGQPEGARPAARPRVPLGERAGLGRASRARAAPRFYFDLRRERKAQAGGESAFTPAISNVVALRAALAAVEAMGGVDALVAQRGARWPRSRARPRTPWACPWSRRAITATRSPRSIRLPASSRARS